MSVQQLIVFGVLAATLAMFIWNRWRYDLVALFALLVLAVAGLVPPSEVFSGFGHPAVVTVAAVLVLSRGLIDAGVVDSIARRLARVGDRPAVQAGVLTAVVTLCSGFMNNVGALALVMPVAIMLARRSGTPPSVLLMPIAFGSLLGGMLTMIGTPPNIIIASYREQTGPAPFGMFDFLPAGGGVALAGVIFIAIVGWRLTPKRKRATPPEELFKVSDYLADVRVREDSKFIGRTLHDLVVDVKEDAEVIVLSLFRGEKREDSPSMYEILRERDILLVEADSDSLKVLLDVAGLELVESTYAVGEEDKPGSDRLNLVEVVVTQESPLVGRTATTSDLRKRYGVNVLAVARQGGQLRERVGRIRFAVGDILLVQGDTDSLAAVMTELECLPLAERGLRLGKRRRVLLATGIFALALCLAGLEVLPAATAMVCGAVLMILAGILSPTAAYRSVDLSIIVLLAAMIPVGEALETSGGARLIADGLSEVARSASPAVMLAAVMIATTLLSNVVNNAAAAILAAPIAVDLARGMEYSADPFLMAVAIGASSAFLTPIGHQSNTLVMVPGGYRFGDYWRMGLPVTIVVVATAVPLILWLWPL